MPRIPRNHLPPHGLFHVTVRGVGSATIFTADAERRFMLALLAREVLERRWRVVAWCLMNTHFHLIVECELWSLSAGMQRMNGTYAQEFNRRHGRWGHLFGDRFASWFIRDEEHLRNAVDYVLNNPVEAGLAATADDWPWSGREHLFDARPVDTL